MQATDLKLIEVSILNLAFEHKQLKPGKGKVKYEGGEIAVETGGQVSSAPYDLAIKVTASPVVTGYKDDLEEDFSLKISMRMIYTYPEKFVADQEFLNANIWYFRSLLNAYFKFYADDIFNKSSLTNISLPFN